MRLWRSYWRWRKRRRDWTEERQERERRINWWMTVVEGGLGGPAALSMWEATGLMSGTVLVVFVLVPVLIGLNAVVSWMIQRWRPL